MKTKPKKYFSRTVTINLMIALAGCLVVAVPAVCLLITMDVDNISGQTFIDMGIYTAYILPACLLLVAARILSVSEYIIFYEDHLTYYRWIFSKKGESIRYDEITECVVPHSLRIDNKVVYGRSYGIVLFDCEKIIKCFEQNYKLVLIFYNIVGDCKFKVTGDGGYLKTIDSYYKIDFSNLNNEQKLILIKHYCNMTKYKEMDGEKYLKKKGLM